MDSQDVPLPRKRGRTTLAAIGRVAGRCLVGVALVGLAALVAWPTAVPSCGCAAINRFFRRTDSGMTYSCTVCREPDASIGVLLALLLPEGTLPLARVRAPMHGEWLGMPYESDEDQEQERPPAGQDGFDASPKRAPAGD